MENQTQSELELELKNTNSQRKSLEKSLDSYQSQVKQLQDDIVSTIDSLKSLQTKENNLQDELYRVQKENIKAALNVNGFKKMFSDSTPFLSSLKGEAVGTVQRMKEYVDGTYYEQKWLDEKYEEYKEHCISMGDEIKSKEEFQKIALALRKMQANEDNDLNFFDLVGKVSKEVGSATTSVKTVFQSLGFVGRITDALSGSKDVSNGVVTAVGVTGEIVSKKTIFNEWFNADGVGELNVSEDKFHDLHENYEAFVEELRRRQAKIDNSL